MFITKKATLILLATAGFVMVFMGLNILISTMDLERYAFSEYIKTGIKSIEWWQVVILPILTGTLFLMSSVIGGKTNQFKGILVSMLVVSIVVVPFHIFVGVIGALTSSFCLMSEKHNKSLKSGTPQSGAP